MNGEIITEKEIDQWEIDASREGLEFSLRIIRTFRHYQRESAELRKQLERMEVIIVAVRGVRDKFSKTPGMVLDQSIMNVLMLLPPGAGKEEGK